jgi:hypothetical protein
MSRVSISKSYAVLVGMESYTRTKRNVKAIEHTLGYKKDKLLHPEKVREREEQEKDKTESAEKERQHLEKRRLEEEKNRQGTKDKDGSLSSRIARKLGLRGKTDKNREGLGTEGRGIPGAGPEDGVPPPEGKR